MCFRENVKGLHSIFWKFILGLGWNIYQSIGQILIFLTNPITTYEVWLYQYNRITFFFFFLDIIILNPKKKVQNILVSSILSFSGDYLFFVNYCSNQYPKHYFNMVAFSQTANKVCTVHSLLNNTLIVWVVFVLLLLLLLIYCKISRY